MDKYNMDNEVWKDISGYEGYYQVSNFGRIKSLKRTLEYSDGRVVTRRERIRKPLLSKGYHLMYLSKGDKQKYFSVHRLVAEAFIPNVEGKPQVNHIDENKTNNNVDNLEWSTSKENSNWGTRNERIKYKNTGGHNRKPILKIDPLSGEVLGEYKTQREAFESVGVYTHSGYIKNSIKRRVSYKGFRWEYKY